MSERLKPNQTGRFQAELRCDFCGQSHQITIEVIDHDGKIEIELGCGTSMIYEVFNG